MASSPNGKKLIDEFFKFFKDSNLNNIDKFLSLNPDYEEIGKHCIVHCLNQIEISNPELTIQKIFSGHDWYNTLVNSLYLDVNRIEELTMNKLSILTYNYDRSLEHYLGLAEKRFMQPYFS